LTPRWRGSLIDHRRHSEDLPLMRALAIGAGALVLALVPTAAEEEKRAPTIFRAAKRPASAAAMTPTT
jgi:hypothetical protein